MQRTANVWAKNGGPNVQHDYVPSLGSLSSDNGDGNEKVISKYKFVLF